MGLMDKKKDVKKEFVSRSPDFKGWQGVSAWVNVNHETGQEEITIKFNSTAKLKKYIPVEEV